MSDLRKSVSYVIGWLNAMLERREYENNTDLRDIRELLWDALDREERPNIADVRAAIGLRKDAELLPALRDMVHQLGLCQNGVCGRTDEMPEYVPYAGEGE